MQLTDTIAISSILTLVFSALGALFRTQKFVDWLNSKVLRGSPKPISQNDLDLINGYLCDEEIRVAKIIATQPELSFQPYDECSFVANSIDHEIADKYQKEQFKSGRPDDPHAFVYQSIESLTLHEGETQEFNVFAIGRYSQLRSLPSTIKHQVLVLGSNNLVLNPKSNNFIFHLRGENAETQSGTLHGFGGGYMPYWEGGSKTISTRRDDCKSLRYTAMRELHEESGFLSLDHAKGFISVIEERHTRDKDGKFGYITFFFTTIVNEDPQRTTYRGDPKEGIKKRIAITHKNLRSMVIQKRFEGLSVHPQLRAQLLLWIFAGCPGLHFSKRWLISNFFTRRNFRKVLA